MALLPTDGSVNNPDRTNAQQKLNLAAIRNFLGDLLGTDSGNKGAARAALGVAPRATSVSVASVAGAVDLTIAAPDSDDITITGALAIISFIGAAGRVFRVRAAGVFTLTNGASIVTHTGANIVAGNGDSFMLRFTADNVVEVLNYVRVLPLVALPIASAATVNLTTGAPSRDDITITGALAITGFICAAGRVFRVRAGGAFTLTNNASIVTQTGGNRVVGVGDTFMLRFTAANVCEVLCYVEAAGPVPSRLATASGSAPSYSARAFVNFNGTGTVAIRSSGNVIGITDNAVGDYTINIDVPLPDANYAAVLQGTGSDATTNQARIMQIKGALATGATLKTTTQLQVVSGATNTSTGYSDMAEMNAVFFS